MTARLLKPAQVLECLPISRATLYRMISRGELTVVRTSTGRVLIPESAVNEWVAANTIPSSHERAIQNRGNIHALVPENRVPALSDDGQDLDQLAKKLGLG